MGVRRRPAASSPAGRMAGIAIALVALGFVAVLALTQSPQRTAADAEFPGAPQDAAAPGAARAPDFEVPLLDGGTFSLARERGHPVLILFTASWCAPCIPEVNKMAQLHEEFGTRGLRQIVLSVDPGDTPETFDFFRLRTRGDRLLWAFDKDQRATRAYRITAVDTKVLIDASGRVAFTSVGPTDLGVLRREVERAFR